MPASNRFTRSSDYGSYSFATRGSSADDYTRSRRFQEYQFNQAIAEPLVQDTDLDSLFDEALDETPAAPATSLEPLSIPRKSLFYRYRTRGPNAREFYVADNQLEKTQDKQIERAPVFTLKLRSHGVWERMYVKFSCKVEGCPTPKVTWYHNQVALDAFSGRYKMSSQFGVHTLEINRAKLSDAGNYRASAQSSKG